ncbi:hypothetical protein V6N12_063672 [Hibiscus sabdariffa]|uniref:Lipoxygenase domain-containing protein n=1 Tax=Hibiscus sabdariffa TaxID=183260 RepID=A0ABR2FCS8_9ROSI
MHPIHKHLNHHMRYILDINVKASELLISINGIIESLFSTKDFSMEITSFAYINSRFDMESLHANLIRRSDLNPNHPHLDFTAEHAALNFGQYHYGAYVPVHPLYMRWLLLDEEDPNYPSFVSDPERYFFSSLPSLNDMTVLMSVQDILCTHLADEEYL